MSGAATSRILVVDDAPDIATVLTLTLRRAGFAVATAVDGLDALEQLAAEVPDLIVLDVMMPRLDGLETLQRIRANPLTAAVPVLLLSARTQVADRLAGFERGADDYLAKPFEPDEVIARVGSLLRRSEGARLTRPLLDLLGAWASAEGLARLGRDLETAREIQSRLIPPIPSRLAGLQAAAALRPSMVVGGDFFDVVPMGPRVGVAIGDVSGKGISAALLMVMVRTLLREVASDLAEPAAVLARLNGSLCRDMPPAMFVTMALAVLDPARPGRVSLASGGHPPAFVLAPPRPVQEIAVEGDILGAFPEARFHQRELALAPGSTLLLMTDGLLEGAGVGGSRTGLPGLRPLLEALQERPLPGLVEGLVGVAPGRGGVPRDDVTVVALRR
jgi:sigma-B regulation protein RsbU (phosphoserine phosphatase)